MTRTLTTPTDRTAAPNLTDHSDACSCRGAAHPLLPRSGSSASAAERLIRFCCDPLDLFRAVVPTALATRSS
jgi:hypothetical protein